LPNLLSSEVSTLEIAREYIERGWVAIPVPQKEKAPRIPGWQSLRVTVEDAPDYFGNGQNVGVLLGEPSRGLTDVDLDCPEALRIAEFFLPKTNAIFGRPSKPKSHWLYYCPEAQTTRFEWKGEVIAEIRSTRAQTIFPPSIHPSGEQIRWDEEGEPATVGFAILRRAVGKLSSCVLLSRYYPAKGSRQFAAMALSGWLLRNGWTDDEVREFLEALCELAKDEETRMRLAQIRNTATKVDHDLPTTGRPTLAGYYPEEVLEKVAEWLELGTEKTRAKQFVVLDKFYPRPFTERLIARYHFWWPGGKEPLYWYDPEQGIWRDDGEELIAHELRTAVEELPDVQKRRYVIDEIIADAKGLCWKGKPLPEPPLNLIPLQNGVFDLETGEVREYRPEDFFTAKLPWRYNPEAKSKHIISLLESFLPQEETITLYELMAYCLFRSYPHQKFFLLFGRGSNGKSLFAKILERFLGKENVASVTLWELQHDNFAAARLYHRLANVSGELEYEDIERTGLLKQLCGGDLVEANRKFRDPVRFQNYAKLIFLTNEIPRSTDTTEAFYRRLFLIEFPKKFEEDPELEVRVATAEAEEYEALLLKVLEVLKALKDRGFVFSRHKSIEETRELYLKLSSPLHTFIEENCEITYQSDDYIYKYEFRERFGQWLKEKGRTAYTDQRLKKEMQSLGIEEARKGAESWWAWVGLKWRDTPSKPSRPSGFYNRCIADGNRFENHDGSDGLDGTPSPHPPFGEPPLTHTFEEATHPLDDDLPTLGPPMGGENHRDSLPLPPAEEPPEVVEITLEDTPPETTTKAEPPPLYVGATVTLNGVEAEITEIDLDNGALTAKTRDGVLYGAYTDGVTYWSPWPCARGNAKRPAQEKVVPHPPCPVCVHPQREEIEYLFNRLIPPKRLGEKYGLSPGDIWTHMRHHRGPETPQGP